jgi:membrane peptidoglycan carboxypeptidase
VVLDLMVKHGYLTAEEARQAKEEKLYFAAAPLDIRAPHFVMYVRGLLEQELGLERLEQGGLSIYTTLDLDLNETARDLARYRLARLAECNSQPENCPPGGHNVRNAAVVALDPQTGEILAMLGSPDYFSRRIDGAVNGTTALRQPGSSIKPITYAAAFAQGELTPATVMVDERTAFITKEGKPYVPLNYDLQFRGPVRLREALASSYNVIAVKVLDAIGVETMTNLARRLGITTFDEPDRLGLAVTLGGGEVRLLELTAAYASFANGGYAVQPVAIRRVEDAEGRVLLAAPPEEGRRELVLDERVAYLISNILSDNVARIPSFGEGSALELSRPAAVKTGTTTDFRDNWTVGYTPDLAIGVWVGNADNEPMHNISGISGAAPLWHDLMEAALKGQPIHEFTRPDGLVEAEVCALSGKLPGPDCPYRVTELFLEGTEPTERAAISDSPSRPIAQLESPPGKNLEAKTQTRPLMLSSPDEGAVYRLDPALPRDAQRIEVAVSPGTGVSLREVTLQIDGRPLARLDAPPYQVLWRLEPGVHIFRAEATGGNGEPLASNEVRIEVME